MIRGFSCSIRNEAQHFTQSYVISTSLLILFDLKKIMKERQSALDKALYLSWADFNISDVGNDHLRRRPSKNSSSFFLKDKKFYSVERG